MMTPSCGGLLIVFMGFIVCCIIRVCVSLLTCCFRRYSPFPPAGYLKEVARVDGR